VNDPILDLLTKEELLRSHGIGHKEIMKMPMHLFNMRAVTLTLPFLQRQQGLM
jgi:hypothetical protein